MKHIVYLGAAVLLLLLVFVVWVAASTGGDDKQDAVGGNEVHYGDIVTQTTPVVTTDIWDYLREQQNQKTTTATAETTAPALLTDEAGNAVTDENGNPLYVIIGTLASDDAANTTMIPQTSETTSTKITLNLQ